VAVAVAVAVGAAELGAAELGAAELGVSGDGLPVGEVADEQAPTVRAAATMPRVASQRRSETLMRHLPNSAPSAPLYFSVGGFSAGDLIGPHAGACRDA
jgi:hypothetical protein